MDKELIIKLILDKSKADQASAQFYATEKKRIAQFIADFDLAEKAKTAISLRESQRRAQGGSSAAEAEKNTQAKALNYAQIVETAKSKVIETQNARRVAAMAQALTAEEHRVARSLNARQIVEQAKSKIVTQENQKRIEAAARSMQSEEDRVGRLLSNTEIAEKAKAAIIERTNKARIDAVLKASISEEEKIGRVLSDTEISEKAKAALIERTNRDRVNAATRASMTEEQLLTKVLTKEEVTLAARSNLIQKANQKRVDAETKALEESQRGWFKLDDSVAKVVTSIGALAAGALTLQGLASAAKAVAGVMEDARKHTQEQLDALLKTKDLIREITLITGSKEGPSDAEVQKFMSIRTASGLGDQEAKEVSLEFEGAAAATKGVNISDNEYDRFKPMVARFAAAAGGGPGAAGTYGKLGGLLAGLGHYDKAEDLLATETQFNRILSRGVGDNPTLIRQAAQVAGAFLDEEGNGIVSGPNELAAMTATASRISPTRAAETMKSSTRVLRGFGEKWDPMLKAAGIDERDSYSAAANKLFSKMEGVQQQGRAVDVWLNEQGVDQRGAMSIMNMYNYRGFLNEAMRAEAKPMTGAEAIGELDQKYRSDVSLRTRVAQAKLDESKIMSAAPLQNDRELSLLAQTRLQQRGEGEDSPSAQAGDWWTGAWSTAGGALLPEGVSRQDMGRRIRIEQEKKAILDEKGISLPGRPDDTSLLGGWNSQYLWWMQNNAASDYSAAGMEMELRGRTMPQGGRVGGPMGQGADGDRGGEILEQLKKVNENLERANQKKDQRPPNVIQARPPVMNR